uniref:PH domain-containing protein n=1 Tax=Globisporangium ultimum (strain ATCC 200006 / CBS 805.95 / DAOM BR144) TaxID=431595 RepID=K3WLT2_GLOUD
MEYGVYGRVLFCGQLEKRRDGAVRGGWASRLFLLTPDALHYFRKVTDYELLGEERGTLALSMIKSVRAMPEDEVPSSAVEPGTEHYYLEITTETRSFLMRTAVSEASTCESWSIAIEEQRKALRAEQTDQRECLSFPEAMPSPTLLARNHELFSLFEASPPRIAMVSVVRVNERDTKPLEEVIKRKVKWGEVLDLGVVPQGGACVILLQDGGIGRIGTQALMGSWDAGQACWIEVTDAESPTEIEVSVTCKVVSQAEKKTNERSEGSSELLPKWVEWVDEGSSVGFLLMCLFVHLLYGVDGFHWSHKCCLTLGAALAISTILNGSSRSPPPQILTPKHSNTSMLPKLQFSLTVHRCRIKMEGTEYLYPNDNHQQALF